jgi:hypothetical protein
MDQSGRACDDLSAVFSTAAWRLRAVGCPLRRVESSSPVRRMTAAANAGFLARLRLSKQHECDQQTETRYQKQRDELGNDFAH